MESPISHSVSPGGPHVYCINVAAAEYAAMTPNGIIEILKQEIGNHEWEPPTAARIDVYVPKLPTDTHVAVTLFHEAVRNFRREYPHIPVNVYISMSKNENTWGFTLKRKFYGLKLGVSILPLIVA